MAIVKMKRLRLMGMRSERESLLHLLQKLGCVEVDEPAIDLSDPQWAAVGKPDGQGLATAREQSNLLNQALNVLARHVSLKGGLLRPRPRLSRKELFDQDSYRRGLLVIIKEDHPQQQKNARQSQKKDAKPNRHRRPVIGNEKIPEKRDHT